MAGGSIKLRQGKHGGTGPEAVFCGVEDMFAKTMLVLFLAVHECKCFILKRQGFVLRKVASVLMLPHARASVLRDACL